MKPFNNCLIRDYILDSGEAMKIYKNKIAKEELAELAKVARIFHKLNLHFLELWGKQTRTSEV